MTDLTNQKMLFQITNRLVRLNKEASRTPLDLIHYYGTIQWKG
jgi:hypothetical protein